MTRQEFLKLSAKFGIASLLAPSLLASCAKDEDLEVNFDGKVIIIGAGAAGMMAAYTLNQYGIDFEILEAYSSFGGRVRKNETLADFPIDIGAEWLHSSPDTLGRLINDDNVQGSVDLIPYQLETLKGYVDGEMTDMTYGASAYGEFKFKSTTWFDFFEDFIVPSIQDKLRLNTVVSNIDYNTNTIIITDSNGNTYNGNKVIVTVPLNILKSGNINFSPDLPQRKYDALDRAEMPDGIKVFIKFSKKFYPDLVAIDGLEGFSNDGRLYYDIAFKKNTSDNILGLFNVGGNASELTSLSDPEIFETVMNQLDEIFDGQASEYYVDHIIQNWSNEPHIQGAYSFYGSDAYEIQTAISEPIDSKVYFAGEALNTNEWSTVHGAGFNGRDVAESIISNH